MGKVSTAHKNPYMTPNMKTQNTVVKKKQCGVHKPKQITTRNRFHVLHTIAEDSDEEGARTRWFMCRWTVVESTG